jgi:spore coat protein U-like protein
MHAMKAALRLAALACALGLPGLAQAQLTCRINNAGPLQFGNYNPLLFTDHYAQTSINVRCNGADWRVALVSLGAGLGGGGVNARAMQRGTARLNYGLYQDAARSNAWGNGSGGSWPLITLVGPGTNVTWQLYGTIPQRQNVPTGYYTDVVQIQVYY